MEYNVIEESAVKTKVEVKVPAEEVEASFAATIAIMKGQVDIKGFRKGKVPASVIESRFKKQILAEASNDLLNVHINEIMGEIGAAPLSRIDVDAGELKRGESFAYSFSFEHAPAFELPQYKGLAVEEEEVEVKDSDVEAVIERIRANQAEVKTISDNREPKNGDVVVVSFEAFENGQPLPGVKAENFQLTLGEGQALEDFEKLVMTIKSGGEGEGEITFPADFINQDLAGKTVLMKTTVHVIKEKILPELNDEFAKQAGNFESLAKMRETIAASYKKSRTDLHKAAAQKTMLDELLAKVEFPLPGSVVEMHRDRLVEEYVDKIERKGKNLEAMGKTVEGLKEEYQSRAEDLVKSQILLQAVAAKEDLSVAPQEMDGYFNQLAVQTGQDVLTLKQYYEDNGLIIAVKDKLLADKAIELMYGAADIKKVPPKAAEDEKKED